MLAAADLIEAYASRSDWVVVNCHAGVNRASTAVIAWLIKHGGPLLFTFADALARVKERKKAAARALRLKTRYDIHRDRWAWPTLYGSGSAQMRVSLIAFGRVCARERAQRAYQLTVVTGKKRGRDA